MLPEAIIKESTIDELESIGREVGCLTSVGNRSGLENVKEQVERICEAIRTRNSESMAQSVVNQAQATISMAGTMEQAVSDTSKSAVWLRGIAAVSAGASILSALASWFAVMK
ncbi:MAG: hypothetical protein IID32_02595 [Planctomycetes bacterium]|nr:hypothetical protein [Planctomycetota bacterium]